jgi:mono/diheme cytochrome c family protein
VQLLRLRTLLFISFRTLRHIFIGAIMCSVATSAFSENNVWQVPAPEAAKENPVRYDVDSVGAGKVLFGEHCQGCHGYWGEGDGIVGLALHERPANLLRIAGKQTVGAFAWKIAEGRGVMPSFRATLDQHEIWQIVNFIESLENEVGSAEQPIVIRRCAMCHGLEGEAFYEGWPDLSEMTQQEIENKLYAHRSRVIEDSTMSKVVFDLTDDEIKEAALYYSSLNQQKP